MKRVRRLAGACAVATALLAPAGASAVPFGPDLDALPANNGPGCAASCMWTFIGTHPVTLVPPASGTVTSVRVKVGGTPGRMRVNIVRFLFQQTGDVAHPISAGPFLEAYGPEFTPAANSVATVPTNLPVTVEPTPAPYDLQTIERIDAVAIEVEDAGVPPPIYPLAGALTYPSYPGPTAQGIPAPSPNALPTYATTGYGVLAAGELALPGAGGGTGNGGNDGGGTGGGGNPGGGGVPTIALPQPTAAVRNGIAPVQLACTGADCAGLLTLQSGGTRAAKKPTVYGKAKFAAAAGKSTTAKVKLNKAGRKLLKHRRKAKVTALVKFASGATKAFALTLKR
jgi:hypothetical protein